ncbi:hypothetical protein LTS18_010462 [Coniosporium uncinatum]|uniref:Uncharacterized protein n=1 Tax=Coniosporium uncinatum TaxID=93489 RepID=A0ACC3CZU4_9PEZI|nr:hypothetical protein LTS18_010462 [Coniosporium uncinatum]
MSQQNNVKTQSDLQDVNDTPEDISLAISGHKAKISNPNTSQESKEASQKALEQLGGDKAFDGKDENAGDGVGGQKQ